MSRARITQTLSSMTLFKSLNPKELELLAMVMNEQIISRGDTICVEGEPGSCCYFIAQGVVEVRVRVDDDNDRLLATLREGQLFGHLSLVDSGPRTATCVAVTTSRLFVLERDDFETLFSSGTRFAFKFQDMIARTAAQQLRLANDRLALMLSRESPQTDKKALSDLRELLARTDTNLEVEVVYPDGHTWKG
jgi:CRP-like cAMP-binding protein